MPTCSFCRKNYEFPRGLTVFTNEGRTVRFCSSKCRRNADLGRDAKKVNWVRREKKSGEEKKNIIVKEEKTEKKEVKKVEKKNEEIKKEEVDDDDEE